MSATRRSGAGQASLLADKSNQVGEGLDDPQHGTGCTLSAAITAALAKGRSLLEAVVDGKAFVYEAIRTGRMVGSSAAVLGQPERLPRSVVTIESAR